ncbi:hypothetical protein [Escherichia coli]|uniref:hypothetical protein n=1 Tax=Escherichia coli TaxID=562 RepID=UPI002FCD475C
MVSPTLDRRVTTPSASRKTPGCNSGSGAHVSIHRAYSLQTTRPSMVPLSVTRSSSTSHTPGLHHRVAL